MRLGRVQAVLAVLLLGVICADIVSGRCDLPSAGGRVQTSVSLASGIDSRGGDRCASGCVPDCYGCSRTDVARPVLIDPEPQIVVATVTPPLARPADGVVALPYHPPLPLL